MTNDEEYRLEQYDQKMRWTWAFTLLGVTIAWGIWCMGVTYKAAWDKLTVDILTASGSSVLLGFLAAMLKDVNQFFFRKAKELVSKAVAP